MVVLLLRQKVVLRLLLMGHALAVQGAAAAGLARHPAACLC
jgi:hypothetical protein